MRKLSVILKAAVLSAAAAIASAVPMTAHADWEQIGYMGDLNGDRTVDVADLVIMSRHIHARKQLTSENSYKVNGKWIGINGADGFQPGEYLITADIDQNSTVDVFDLILLKQTVISQSPLVVWQWEDTPQTTTSTTSTTYTSTTTTTTATTAPARKDFIDPPIYDLYGSLPSQGEAKAVVFYVDFPDCKFSYDPPVSQIYEAAFGKEDPTSKDYPFESISAFYKRSSKGIMDLDGEVIRYSAKDPVSTYENDVWHKKLIDEIISQNDGKIDFSRFDGDGDKVIDAMVVVVPSTAGEDNWWPAAGIYGGENGKTGDGVSLGHVMVGNCAIDSTDDSTNFSTTCMHELGHCMGLPDFYLYNGSQDFYGLHGSAGFEIMDESKCDFSSASKLMLGWYKKDQVKVYDSSFSSQTYTLYNDQSDKGNCVILPIPGRQLNNYYTEFFIIDYTTLDTNNSRIKNDFWWWKYGSGVRILHVDATLNGDRWNNSWKYGNNTDNPDGEGRRFIRVIRDINNYTDNLCHTGDVIDNSVQGFGWYDQNGYETVDPGYVITVGEQTDDSYTITVTLKK